MTKTGAECVFVFHLCRVVANVSIQHELLVKLSIYTPTMCYFAVEM